MIDQDRFRGMTWLGKMRLRLFVSIVGIPLAVFGVVSIGPGWLTLPLVGVAFAAVTVTVNKVTSRLAVEHCWTCGTSLKTEPAGEQGKVCPSCGSLNQFNPMHLAMGDTPDAGYDFSLDDEDEKADDGNATA